MKIAVKSKTYFNENYKGLYRFDPIPNEDLKEKIFSSNPYLYKLWDWYINNFYSDDGINFVNENFLKAYGAL